MSIYLFLDRLQNWNKKSSTSSELKQLKIYGCDCFQSLTHDKLSSFKTQMRNKKTRRIKTVTSLQILGNQVAGFNRIDDKSFQKSDSYVTNLNLLYFGGFTNNNKSNTKKSQTSTIVKLLE